MRVYHFMRYKWWFLGSLTAVTIFAVIAIFVVGLDLGIDFKGGVRMEVSLEQEASVDDIRAIVRDVGVEEPVVQSVGTPVTGSSFMITAQVMEQAQIEEVQSILKADYGLDEQATAVEQVGASFGATTTRMAFIGVAIAIVLIIGYVSFRYDFKYAIPAIAALVHDVGLTLGIYAVSSRLVTSATVAAILTILGYSVHDTIVVFDRMRENTLLMKKETYGDMVDLSIRQTMVRSINTSISTLLPLLAILIFGGPTLKDFALALTIGVITGTYSSFCVAAPLVTLWKEREPQFKRRLAAAKAGQLGGAQTGTVSMSSGEKGAAASTRVVTPGAAPKSGGQAVPSRRSGSSKKGKSGSASRRAGGKGHKRPSR